MYVYEKIPQTQNKEYIDKIYKIEDIKEKIKINVPNIQINFKKDIFESNKLEGNQLEKSEVENFLKNGITIRGKSFRDFVQVNNYHHVLEAAKDWIKNGREYDLNADIIFSIHKMITANELPVNESGVLRNDNVHIRSTSYIPPDAYYVPHAVEELLDKYNNPLSEGETQFEKICEFKRNFERIHPFFDGNGRTGRLMMNMLFLQNGYGYISFPATERDIYFQSLENNTFHELAADKMLKCMEKIYEQQINKNIKNKEEDYYER